MQGINTDKAIAMGLMVLLLASMIITAIIGTAVMSGEVQATIIGGLCGYIKSNQAEKN